MDFVPPKNPSGIQGLSGAKNAHLKNLFTTQIIIVASHALKISIGKVKKFVVSRYAPWDNSLMKSPCYVRIAVMKLLDGSSMPQRMTVNIVVMLGLNLIGKINNVDPCVKVRLISIKLWGTARRAAMMDIFGIRCMVNAGRQ